MSSELGSSERFIQFLESLVRRGDRGALAALRRVVGRDVGEWTAADRLLLPWLQPGDSARRISAHYVVAGLFALYPDAPSFGEPANATGRSLGASLRRLADASLGDGTERRLRSLLAAEFEDVTTHLRSVTPMLRAKRVPVDWRQLLRDLLVWDGERRVQRRWAIAFWAGRAAREANEATVSAATPGDSPQEG